MYILNLRGHKAKGETIDKEFEKCASRESIGLFMLQILGDDIGLFILMTSHILSSFWEAKIEKTSIALGIMRLDRTLFFHITCYRSKERKYVGFMKELFDK